MESVKKSYDGIESKCLETYDSASPVQPYVLLEQMMDIPEMAMHCPEHHYMIPALLLTQMAMATKAPREKLQKWLAEAKVRAMKVPGGFCGWYGDCGAAVGTGIFLSVYTGTNPKSDKHWADCHKMTAKALLTISEVEGPRCCKRNCFLALKSAIETIREMFGIEFNQGTSQVCRYFERNKECKKEACPFYPKEN